MPWGVPSALSALESGRIARRDRAARGVAAPCIQEHSPIFAMVKGKGVAVRFLEAATAGIGKDGKEGEIRMEILSVAGSFGAAGASLVFLPLLMTSHSRPCHARYTFSTFP